MTEVRKGLLIMQNFPGLIYFSILIKMACILKNKHWTNA